MDRRQAALEAARRWRDEGLITADQFATIEARERQAEAREPRRESLGILALHAIGGLLLGAAAIAFVVFVEPAQQNLATIMFLVSLLPLAGAVAARAAGASGPLVDALLLAFLVPGTFGGVGPERFELARNLSMLVLVAGVGAWRRHRDLPVGAAAISLHVLVGFLVMRRDLPDAQGFSVWFAVVVLLLAGAYVAAKRLPVVATTGIPVTTVAYGIASLTWLDEALHVDWDLWIQLAWGALLGLAVAAGALLRQPLGAVLAGGFLAGDAVWLAFDLGDLIGSVLVLAAIGAALLAWGQALLRWVKVHT